jgi:hypothetical protein
MTVTLCLHVQKVPELVFITWQFFIHAKSKCQLKCFDNACFVKRHYLAIYAVTSARLHLCLPLSRNSFDSSRISGRRQTDRHPRLFPFSSFPLRWNKTYYNIDQTHPHVALNCTPNCESCFTVSGTRARSRVCASLVTVALYWHMFKCYEDCIH